MLTENHVDGTEKSVTTDQLGQNNPVTQTENEKAIQSDYRATILSQFDMIYNSYSQQ